MLTTSLFTLSFFKTHYYLKVTGLSRILASNKNIILILTPKKKKKCLLIHFQKKKSHWYNKFNFR